MRVSNPFVLRLQNSVAALYPVEVPPIRLSNSDRLQMLIRAGKLYLTAHDAIALALENNIDIEICPLQLEPDGLES